MQAYLRAGSLALAIVGSAGFAAAQNQSGDSPERFNLSRSQEQAVSQGLRSEPAQSTPGYQGQVGLEYEINAKAPLQGMIESMAYMRGVLAAVTTATSH